MTKMSFAQRLDVWRTLTAPSADLADEVPGLAELRGELATILNEVQKTSATCRRLRTRALVEAKRLEQAITRGEEAEQRLRRFLQASYGPASQELYRFGLKPRRGRRPERSVVGSVVPSDEIEEPPAGGE
jgi:hypothetical protein